MQPSPLWDRKECHPELPRWLARFGQSVGRNDLVILFLKGPEGWIHLVPVLFRLGTCPRSSGMSEARPLSRYSRPLSLKTALSLALASVKRQGALQVLTVTTSCLEFAPNDCKVVLKPRHGSVPKRLFTPFRAQVITLSDLAVSGKSMGCT